MNVVTTISLSMLLGLLLTLPLLMIYLILGSLASIALTQQNAEALRGFLWKLATTFPVNVSENLLFIVLPIFVFQTAVNLFLQATLIGLFCISLGLGIRSKRIRLWP